MNSLSRQKLHEESRVVKGLRIAGSYGKYALLSLITAAYLSALADGSLTFTCTTKPTTAITVNVEINNVRGLSE